jgi:hypothetical protein
MTHYYYYRVLPPPKPAPQKVCPPVQQQGAAIQTLRKQLDGQQKTLNTLRAAVDKQGNALKQLEIKLSATPSVTSEVIAGSRKNAADIANHARVIGRHAEIINHQAKTIAGMEHTMAALTAVSGTVGVLLAIILVVALWKRLAKPRVPAHEQLFEQAMAEGRAPTANEIAAAWNRMAGGSP